MEAKMATGMFQYEACELRVEDRVLLIRFPRTGELLHISTMTEASLTRNQSGLYQLQLATPTQQYEFLVEDGKKAEEALQVLLELTKGSARLELRQTE